MKNVLSKKDLELLSSLVGDEFRFFGGPEFSSHLIAQTTLVGFQKTCLDITADVIFSDFQGFPNEFSKFEISLADSADIVQAENLGNLYFFNKGKRLAHVTVIEEVIEEKSQSQKNWDYEADVAIIFHFDSGKLALSKLSHHDEAVKVTYVESGDEIEIPTTGNYFEDDLIISHTIVRNELTLTEALARFGQ